VTTSSQPIGLSTSWTGAPADPDRLLDQVRALGFRRIEAYTHFTPARLRALAETAPAHGVEIGSLHGPCPVATNDRGDPLPFGDWLASTREEDRTRAVDLYRRTIDAAAEAGARGVVIHLGTTGAPSQQRMMFDVIARSGRDSDEYRRLRETALRDRVAASGAHLEAALGSIRALGEHALGTSVQLGVECRDNYVEIPSLDEVDDVLRACDGLPVGYWHDAGHGAKLEYLGLVSHEDYLRRYGALLVGMHIHDTRASLDHQAPGQGDTDFGMLARYLQPGTIRTLELRSSVTAAQIAQGLNLLAGYDTFGVREGILVEL
jgi:sugar phosphate isomerase/epimerase